MRRTCASGRALGAWALMGVGALACEARAPAPRGRPAEGGGAAAHGETRRGGAATGEPDEEAHEEPRGAGTPEPGARAAPAAHRAEEIDARGCTAGDPEPLATVHARAIAVAATEHARLVVLDPADGGFVVLAPPDDAGEGELRRREIPRARGESILTLEPAGDRFLLVGLAPCTSAGLATECLVARSISTGGELESSPPVEVALPGRIRTIRVFQSRSLVYVARSHAGATPGLERFEVGADGTVTHVRRVFGDAIPADEPVEILGMTADGAGWAVLYRHGATEDSESGVVLCTQLDEHEVGELDEVLLVESMAWVGTSLALIAAFEFARPSWVRLTADGEVITAPRALPPGEEAPVPFAGRRTARIVGHAGSRELEIRDAMGDRVGARVPLGPGTADVAREEGGFVVARLEEDGAASLRTIHCP